MAISRLAANARAQFLSSWDVSQCAVGSCWKNNDTLV
jgi:hypothetical protein